MGADSGFNISMVRRGFTLVEMLIVVAIAAVLIGGMGLSFVGSQKSARDAKRKLDLGAYRGALELYANSSGGVYPVFLSNTSLTDSSCVGLSPTYLGKCLADPKPSSTYYYRSTAGGVDHCVWTTLERSSNCYRVCSDGKALEYAGASPCNPASIP